MTIDRPDWSEPVGPPRTGPSDDQGQPPDGPVYPGTPMRPPAPPPPGSVPPASAPVPAERARWPVAAAVVIGIAALCCIGGIAVIAVSLIGGQPASDGDTAPAPGAAEETPDAPGLRTPVHDGRFEFVVNRIQCGIESIELDRFSETADGQFCLVHLSVRNIGDQPQMFSDAEQKAFGPDGAEYGADSAASVLANRGTDVHLRKINPGNRISGVVVFDIPPSSGIVRLQLHDSLLSAGTQVVVN